MIVRLHEGWRFGELDQLAVENACRTEDIQQIQTWIDQARRAADPGDGAPGPTVVLPLDQAEELFPDDAAGESPRSAGWWPD